MIAEGIYTIKPIPTAIKLHPVVTLTDDQFFEFCQTNSDYRFERTVQGELVIMSPTGSESGRHNFNLAV